MSSKKRTPVLGKDMRQLNETRASTMNAIKRKSSGFSLFVSENEKPDPHSAVPAEYALLTGRNGQYQAGKADQWFQS